MAHVTKYPVRLQIASARFVLQSEGVPARRRPQTAACARGLAHERKLAEALADNPWVVIGPWIEYTLMDGTRGLCQPDFLHFDHVYGRLTVIEAKLRHCAAAYYQLMHLYLPVLQTMFPSWHIRAQEVVRWYSHSEPFPGEHVLRRRIFNAPNPPAVGVHIFNGDLHG